MLRAKLHELTAILAICLPLVNACSVPDMRVNQGLQQDAAELPVVGRSAFRVSLGKEKGFGFGAYQLADIQRGWTNRGWSFSFAPLNVSEAYQKYSFGVKDTTAQKTWYVQAAAMLDATTVEAGGWSVNLDKQREFLQVAFESPESGQWRLSLADPGNYIERKNFEGKISNGKYEIEVHPLYKAAGKSLPASEALGYEFSREGHVLGSVQTMNNGKVWLRNSLSPDMKMVIASVSASLLLYQQLGEEHQ